MDLNRVAVFIDNSNVFKTLQKFRKVDNEWVCLYDPLFLSYKLSGFRKLVYVGFYCSPPPAYLASGNAKEKFKYARAMQYYDLISKLENVDIKYGTLNGYRNNLQEKNLDT